MFVTWATVDRIMDEMHRLAQAAGESHKALAERVTALEQRLDERDARDREQGR